MDRSAEGDWINGSAISSSQFTLLWQHLMEKGVLEKGDTIWWCPLPLDKPNLRKLESPQSNESRLISFNITSTIDRTMAKYFPHLRCTSLLSF